jgi:hypothetical protein
MNVWQNGFHTGNCKRISLKWYEYSRLVVTGRLAISSKQYPVATSLLKNVTYVILWRVMVACTFVANQNSPPNLF